MAEAFGRRWRYQVAGTVLGETNPVSNRASRAWKRIDRTRTPSPISTHQDRSRRLPSVAEIARQMALLVLDVPLQLLAPLNVETLTKPVPCASAVGVEHVALVPDGITTSPCHELGACRDVHDASGIADAYNAVVTDGSNVAQIVGQQPNEVGEAAVVESTY